MLNTSRRLYNALSNSGRVAELFANTAFSYEEFSLNKQKAFRYVLAAGVAAAVSMPLIAQVKNAQSAAHQASVQAGQAVQAQAKLEPAAPTTMPEVDPSKVILTQGDITVTAGEFSAIVATLPAQYQTALSDPTIKKRIGDRIVQVKQLAEEARKRGIQDKPQLKQQIEMQADELLVNALAKEVQGGGNERRSESISMRISRTSITSKPGTFSFVRRGHPSRQKAKKN